MSIVFKGITLTIASVMFFISAAVNASAYCTYDKVISVKTGGNNSAACFMTVKSGETTISNIKICESADEAANNRNYSLATTALLTNKPIQIYSPSIASCDEITKWFKDVTYLTLLGEE